MLLFVVLSDERTEIRRVMAVKVIPCDVRLEAEMVDYREKILTTSGVTGSSMRYWQL